MQSDFGSVNISILKTFPENLKSLLTVLCKLTNGIFGKLIEGLQYLSHIKT